MNTANIFTAVKERIAIYDVIKEYVTLKRAGKYYKGQCPFHSERTGSFTVSPHREIYYCFGCHKSGDVIGFIAEIERCSQLEAAMHVIKQYGLTVPEEYLEAKHSDTSTYTTMQRYIEICALVARWCHEQLVTSTQAMRYIQGRGINQDTISQFILGYFPERGIPALLEYAQKAGFLLQDLITAHIIYEGKFNLYSPLTERIIFPIRDYLGRTCGFGGRVFLPDDQRPKYYNSPDQAFFNKSTLLFGLDRAKKALQEAGDVFLVEGYLDAIAMAQAGYTNTIATLGTACTVEHLRLLSRYVTRVQILYDGDRAGQNAISKLAQLAWNAALELTVITLPEQEDPASLLQKNGKLDKLIENAQDIFVFFINQQGADYQTKNLPERVQIVRHVILLIATVEDSLKQNLLLQKAALAFDIPLDVLLREIRTVPTASPQTTTGLTGGITGAGSTDYSRTLSTEEIKDTNQNGILETITPLEEKLVRALITQTIHSTITLSPEDKALILESCSELIRPLLSYLLKTDSPKEQEVPSLTALVPTLEPRTRAIMTRILVEQEEGSTTPNSSTVREECSIKTILKEWWKKEWKRQAHDITVRMKAAEQRQERDLITQLTQRFIQLKLTMQEKGIL